MRNNFLKQLSSALLHTFVILDVPISFVTSIPLLPHLRQCTALFAVSKAKVVLTQHWMICLVFKIVVTPTKWLKYKKRQLRWINYFSEGRKVNRQEHWSPSQTSTHIKLVCSPYFGGNVISNTGG